MYSTFSRLKEFTDSVGVVYGTEDFSIYLYSLVKMVKPNVVLELGTGLGCTMSWMALALKENQKGILHTVDNGSEWHTINQICENKPEFHRVDYQEYIYNLIDKFELDQQIKFYNQKISHFGINNIDILFSDFNHSPHGVLECLAQYLGSMNKNSYIFIDSASTYYSSYQLLETIVAELNQGRIPLTLQEMTPLTQQSSIQQCVANSRFRLSHIIENKKRNQNSTACIQIEPRDVFPQPRINIRF